MLEDSLSHAATNAYLTARAFVVAEGYGSEIDWQRSQIESSFNESDLLREAAWVILCSGFRESVVRQKFNHISLCFCDWHSAEEILSNSPTCQNAALRVFGSKRKMAFITSVCWAVANAGFENLKVQIAGAPYRELQKFPGVGPITAKHLAKNLGFACAKQDRHLIRVANHMGYSGVDELCRTISDVCGDPVSVVDIVLWRYCTLKSPETLPGPSQTV